MISALSEISPNELTNDIPRENIRFHEDGSPEYFGVAVRRLLMTFLLVDRQVTDELSKAHPDRQI